jgi:hypothetical protein
VAHGVPDPPFPALADCNRHARHGIDGEQFEDARLGERDSARPPKLNSMRATTKPFPESIVPS